MKNREKTSNEIRSLRRELLETRHQLSHVEAARSFRMLQFGKEFIKNPIKGLGRLGEVPGLFKRIEIPEPDFDPVFSEIFAPQPLHDLTTMFKYPHLKIACLGTSERFYNVAHAFEMADVNWSKLLELGIDLAVIDAQVFTQVHAAPQWLKLLKQKTVPIVIVAHNKNDLEVEPAKSAKLIVSAEKLQGTELDRPFVDIQVYNPKRWPTEPKEQELIINSVETVDYSGVKNHKAVVFTPKALSDKPKAAAAILNFASMGVPVIINSEDKPGPLLTDLPVKIVSNKKQLATELNNLNDTEYREKYSIKLRRHVHLNWSQINYLEWLMKKFKLPLLPDGKISIILSTVRPNNLDIALKNVSTQTYPNKELILILHGDDFKKSDVEKKTKVLGYPVELIFRPSKSLFGDNLNLGLEKASGKYITKMDDDDFYGPNHLYDLLAAYRYSGAEIVGKWSNWVYLSGADMTVSWAVDRQERFGNHLPGATIFTEKTILDRVRFGHVKRAIDSEMLRRLEMRGARFYSTHRYNFMRIRHDSHTYKVDEEKFLTRASGKKHKGYTEEPISV